MRVLLTGASGFIGSYVLESLSKHNIEVVAIGRRPPSSQKISKFIETDILSNPDLYKLFDELRATHLLHLAWYAEHGKYWKSAFNLRWVDSSIRLVEAFCKTGGEHVTIAGTCAEYDWSYGYCREDVTPLKPRLLYGTAKDATRRLTSEICADYQVPIAWGRIFLPFGKGESNQRLLPSLIDVFQGRRKPFEVNTSAYRDFIHVSDVAKGFITLVKNSADGIFNVSSGVPLRLADLIIELANILDVDPETVLALSTERLIEPRILLGDNSKLQSLGWNVTISLQSGLKQSIEL